MRILLISNVYPPNFIGGYELAALEVAEFLNSKGFDVQVLTSDSLVGNNSNFNQILVTRSLQCSSLKPRTFTPNPEAEYINLWNIRQIASKISEFSPDLIMLWNLQSLGAIGILKFVEALNIPTYLYLMDNIFLGCELGSRLYEDIQNNMGSITIPSNVRVVSMSERLIKEIEQETKISVSNFLKIPGWVRTSVNPTESSLGRTDSDKFSFIFSSRVAPHKGVGIILDAVTDLTAKGIKDFSVNIYGLGEIGPTMDMVEARNLQDYIIYKGTYEKSLALDILSNHDCLLFPTWKREAFGFVAIEAASVGCIPILTEGIGAGEWLKNGIDCLKIERDSKSLSDAMLYMMSISNDQLQFMKRNGIELGTECFNFEHWMRVLIEDIHEFLSKRDFSKKPNPFQVERAFFYLFSKNKNTFNNSSLTESYRILMNIYSRLPGNLKKYIKRLLSRP